MEIPYTVKARPDTGLWNAKVGIWLFLASEVMLFGGLFSSYIFLRIGADFPWPVHVLTVKWGFINTLVLIFSSVTVLQAWLALKMRKYGMYKVWMSLTILCALGFMCIKAVEYNDKFHHYGVKLQDGSVLEGHLPNNEYLVKFGDVGTVTLAARKNAVGLGGRTLPFVTAGSDAGFLKFLSEGSKADFKDVKIVIPGEKEIAIENGKTVTLSSGEISRLLDLAVAEARKIDEAKRSDAKKLAADSHADYKAPALMEAFVKLTAVTPLKFAINPGKIHDYGAGKVTFKDGTELEGKLVDDTLRLQTDKVDVRRLIDPKQNVEKTVATVEEADAWRILGPEWKEKFFKHVEEETEKFHKDHAKQDPMHNADFVRETFTMEISLEGAEGGHEPKAAPAGGHKAEEKPEHGVAPAHESGGHHAHPEVAIAKKDVAFYSNFTPKYNNYFAIYFALTGLHGLHVLAGALVLTYMLFFGKRIYSKNPEHQANRVETVGLFWHFVDLIWIFLFPLLYLM